MCNAKLGPRSKMTQLNVFVSLITEDNDFQTEQAAAANDAARRLNVNLQIVYASNDAVNQSQQLLKIIQNPAQRPNAILVEPVGTGMPQVAGAAAAAAIGWAVINREVDYVSKLRAHTSSPIFALTTDQEEVGKIQGQQLSALLKDGGGVLYIEGPSAGDVARRRTAGMQSTKPPNINIKMLKGDWTETSGYRAVKSWLALSTSQSLQIRAITGQNDAMAIGARRAFEEVADTQARKDWLSLAFTGCDGVPKTGQEWVRRGLLAATVITPPLMGLALEMMTHAIRTGTQPPPRTLSQVISFPGIKELASSRR
jgi:ribose transport system substrate-binding protein